MKERYDTLKNKNRSSVSAKNAGWGTAFLFWNQDKTGCFFKFDFRRLCELHKKVEINLVSSDEDYKNGINIKNMVDFSSE